MADETPGSRWPMKRGVSSQPGSTQTISHQIIPKASGCTKGHDRRKLAHGLRAVASASLLGSASASSDDGPAVLTIHLDIGFQMLILVLVIVLSGAALTYGGVGQDRGSRMLPQAERIAQDDVNTPLIPQVRTGQPYWTFEELARFSSLMRLTHPQLVQIMEEVQVAPGSRCAKNVMASLAAKISNVDPRLMEARVREVHGGRSFDARCFLLRDFDQ